MEKSLLRSLFLEQRKALTHGAITDLSVQLLRQCRELPIWEYERFHVFLSISDKNEVDTAPLIAQLFELKKQVVVPKISGRGVLEHYQFTPDTPLAHNQWGVPEPVSGSQISPAELEVVFVPLLAFDLRGYRVGYGGGYYDNFLAACNPKVITVGLSLFDPVDEIVDVYSGDVPLKYVVCPNRIYRF